jgi:hypothetical protein
VADAKQSVEAHAGVICTLLFDADVKNADFYEIEIGSRGKLSYSKKDLEKRDWYVAQSLGT